MVTSAKPLLSSELTRDRQVVERILGGDSAAFALLVEAHAPALRAVIRAVTRQEDLVDDVLQDVWMLTFRQLASWSAAAPLRAWLRTLARREAIRTMKCEERHSGRLDAQAVLEELEAPGSERQPLDDLEEARRWLAALPAHERRSFELAASGWSYAEIAARARLPVGTIGTHVHRARRRLAEELGRPPRV